MFCIVEEQLRKELVEDERKLEEVKEKLQKHEEKVTKDTKACQDLQKKHDALVKEVDKKKAELQKVCVLTISIVTGASNVNKDTTFRKIRAFF